MLTLTLDAYLERVAVGRELPAARVAALARPYLSWHLARRVAYPHEVAAAWDAAAAGEFAPERELFRSVAAENPRCRLLTSPSTSPRLPSGGIMLSSTPRCGNSILRRVLVRMGFVEVLAHDLHDVEWNALPDGFVLQCHVRRTEAETFVNWSKAKTVTISRHPIDTLLSAWNYATWNPTPRFWLGGTAALPACKTEFLDWATGPGAAALLSVTPSHWDDPEVIAIRYEDLMAAPEAVVASLAESLGMPFESEELLAFMDEEAERFGRHVWRKTPGAWRELPAEVVKLVSEAHADVFAALGYPFPTWD